MAAPKGNSYGRLAINPGCPLKFTPDELWGRSLEYFEWCDNNPEYRIEMLKKPIWEEDLFTGEMVLVHYIQIPIKNAYLLSGLCLWLGVNKNYFTDFIDRMKEDEPKHIAFARVVRAILLIIESQQVQGGLNGTLNANLVARLQGIAEKRETENKNTNTSDDIDYDQLDDETLEKIAKAKKK